MRHALLDTNFLLVPGRFKVDVFAELERLGYKPVVLSCVFREVEEISRGRSRAAAQAKAALEIIEKEKPEIIEAAGLADAALLREAAARGWAIATNDIRLIAQAKKKGLSVLRLRQKSYVVEV